jgi:hypothetical protein
MLFEAGSHLGFRVDSRWQALLEALTLRRHDATVTSFSQNSGWVVASCQDDLKTFIEFVAIA